MTHFSIQFLFYNVLYKICSEVLANKLRPFMNDIISKEQSAFVPEQLIIDNVLVAYESIHHLKPKKGKSRACAIKLETIRAIILLYVIFK
jgi:hypothetical protein